MVLSSRRLLAFSVGSNLGYIKMKRHDLTQTVLLGAGLWLLASSSHAQPKTVSEAPPTRDLMSDTWVAVDDLGRATPVGGQVRAPQTDKTVAMFYYIAKPSTHSLDLKVDDYSHNSPAILHDVTKIIAANPDATTYGQPNAPNGTTHWWGEPLFGYYFGDDPWVIRKHLSMLSDAGVDALFFDVTNSPTYRNNYMAILAVAWQMRRDGNVTPQFAFVTHARTAQTVTKLYDEFYAIKRYEPLWFRWQGKPLMIGDVNAKYESAPEYGTMKVIDDDYLPTPNGNWKKDDPLPDEIKNFFTWRQSWAWSAGGWFGDGKDKWPWLDYTPQKFGWHDNPQTPEQVAVASAQHPTTNIGKSYHDGKEPPLNKNQLTADTNKGLYFAEQWKVALKTDPQLIWVTQWNEWIAGRWFANQGENFIGRKLNKGDGYFVDAYNAEFNRDIEPMKGGWGDNYYLQMVDGVRRFKGARPLPVDDALRTVNNWDDWKALPENYRDASGDTAARDWPGWGGKRYLNVTARNDFENAKVATDADNITFYIQTKDAISNRRDRQWMQLLVNSDQNYATGWNGYDFCVNFAPLSETETAVAQWKDGGWKRVARADYKVRGNEMQNTVPRAVLEQNHKVAFDFHWVDNAPIEGDITNFYVDGDSAPNGRFNYRYSNSAAK